MSKSLYRKLSIIILKNNKQSYIPFVATCAGVIALYYIILALYSSRELKTFTGMSTLNAIISLVLFIVGMFSVIFIFYTNSFLMKRRKSEFALYNMLGTQKKHLLKILAWESFYTGLLSILTGIAVGVIFYKIAESIFFSIIGIELSGSYIPDTGGIITTSGLFSAIFLVVYISNAVQIIFTKPINLLSSAKRGERVPKVNLVYSLIGIISLATGYYLAVSTEKPLKALFIFFAAALLVMIGTYLCFIQVSILLLKMLQKSKGFYYKSTHFTSISGLIFRIRQNAVGLANICILSTAVLVVASVAISFYAAGEEMLRFRYPRNIVISIDEADDREIEELNSNVDKLSSEMDITRSGEYEYNYNAGYAEVFYKNNFLEFEPLPNSRAGEVLMGSGVQLSMLSVDDIKKYINVEALKENEVYLAGEGAKLDCEDLKVGDRIYKVNILKNTEDVLKEDKIIENYYLIFPSKEDMEIASNALYKEGVPEKSYIKAFDLKYPAKVQIEFFDKLKQLTKANEKIYVESSEHERTDFKRIYGGMFFSGILLGFVFMIAIVLIIYYKQMVEGYEDKKRFEIMKKIGMTKKEIKKSIHSQILTVFFLPLILSGVHLCFAFPVLVNLLKVLNMQNIVLFIIVCTVVYIAFALIYVTVYMLTSKTYYSIVVE